MPKKCTYTLRIDQSRSKSIENVLLSSFSNVHTMLFPNVLVIVRFSKSTIFKICRQKMCRFRVSGRPIRHIFHRFQNVPKATFAIILQTLSLFFESDEPLTRYKLTLLGQDESVYILGHPLKGMKGLTLIARPLTL